VEVAVLTPDHAFAALAERVLGAAEFRVAIAGQLSSLPGALPRDVLIVDPIADRHGARVMLDVLARVPTRPATVLLLRAVEDLQLAEDFRVAVIAIDVAEELLGEVVQRARRDHRRARLAHE
jgi:hypothetical protein